MDIGEILLIIACGVIVVSVLFNSFVRRKKGKTCCGDCSSCTSCRK